MTITRKQLIFTTIILLSIIGLVTWRGCGRKPEDRIPRSGMFEERQPLPTRKAVNLPEKQAPQEGIIKVTVAKLKPVEDNLPLISAGIPFAKGQLSDPKNIAFFDNDVQEIPIATKVLARWPQDNSIRSILVQFKYPVEKVYQYLAMRWGHPRKTEDLGIVEPRWDLPQGLIILPSRWLCDSEVVGEQVPMGQRIVPEYDQKIIKNLPQIKDELWTNDLIQDGYYSTPHSFYQFYARSGALAIFLAARRELLHYRETQIIHEGKDKGMSTAGPKPRYIYMQAMADDYFLTGDPRTLEVAAEMVQYLEHNFRPGDAFYPRQARHHWTERRQAFPFLGVLTYYEMTGQEKYLDLADRYMQNLYKTQMEWPGRGGFIHNLYTHDPEEGARKDEYGGSPFMTGLLLESIIKYHRLTKSDIAADSIFRALEWLMNEGLSPSGDAFRYLTADKYLNDPGQPDLDPLIAHAFGYGYKISGYKDQRYLDAGMKVFLRGVKDGYVGRRKHFNQAFRSSGHFLAYIQEGILQLQGLKKEIPIPTEKYQDLFSSSLNLGGTSQQEPQADSSIYGGRLPAVLYVSPDGTLVGGCTRAHPCREIGRAASFAIPGDTVIIEEGNYPGFAISDIHGTLKNPIIIKAKGDVSIRPESPGKISDNIHVSNCDWIVIDGIKSFNAMRAGIRINNSHHITVKNGTFGHNEYWGIFTNHSNDLVLENNECFGSKKQHGIYVSNSGDRPVVRGNKLYDNHGCGLHMNGDLSSGGGRNVPADGIISNALVEANIIYNNGKGGGAAINLDGVQDSLIRNNLSFENHAGGITAYRIDGGQGPGNLKIYNNTVVMAKDARWAMVVNNTAGPVVIMNNIFYNKNFRRGGLSIGNRPSKWNQFRLGLLRPSPEVKYIHSDYNIFGGGKGMATTDDNETRFNLRIWRWTGNDKHSLQVRPDQIFKDAGNNNYQLKKNSVAVDAGIKLDAVTQDIDGTPRPQGRGYDIGAVEFKGRPTTSVQSVPEGHPEQKL